MTRQTRKPPAARPTRQPSQEAAPPPPAPPPSPPSPPSQAWLGWAAVILVLVVLLIGIAIGVERWNDGDDPAGAEVQITPIVGGMAVATDNSGESRGEPEVTATQSGMTVTADLEATNSLTAASGAGQTVESVTRTAGLTLPAGTAAGDSETVFAPGVTVQNGAGSVEIFAEPSQDGQVLDSYAPGVALTVIEPGSDFAGYPVEVDGAGWVRVRAEDGLAGWTPVAGLTLAD